MNKKLIITCILSGSFVLSVSPAFAGGNANSASRAANGIGNAVVIIPRPTYSPSTNLEPAPATVPVPQSPDRPAPQRPTDLHEGGINSPGSMLSGQNFSGRVMQGSNLAGSNLSGTNFSGSDLRGTNFSGANLSGANFSGADLRNVNFAGANTSGANFTGAIR